MKTDSSKNPKPFFEDNNFNFLQLLRLLLSKSLYIVGFTLISTIIVFVFLFNQKTPVTQYKAQTTFVSPDVSSIIQLNKLDTLDVSVSDAYIKFLNNVNSKLLQQKVFIDGGYSKKLNLKHSSKPSRDDYISRFTSSIVLKTQKNSGDYELPYTLSIVGVDGPIIAEFLDEVVNAADKHTVDIFTQFSDRIVENDLNVLNKQRESLFIRYSQDRLATIERIKAEDDIKLNEINNTIYAVRAKAKQSRLNQIEQLTNAANMAKTLGYIDNNLEQFSQNMRDINLNIAINDTATKDELPDWYLYGETAILKMLEVLKTRTTDDPFIPELIDLENQIYKIKNNSTLRELETRVDDSPYIEQLSSIDSEIRRLMASELDANNISVVRINQRASYTALMIANKNSLIMMLTFFASFAFSILIIILMRIFKEVKLLR